MNITKWAGVVLALGVALGVTHEVGATKMKAVEKASFVAMAAESNGYVCRPNIQVAELDRGEGFIIETILYGGNQYKIIGAGDDGISDLDMGLYDEDGVLVAKDTNNDAVPVLDVSPRSGITMAKAFIKVVVAEGGGWATAVICHKKR